MVNIFTAMKLGMTFCTNTSGIHRSTRDQSAAPICAEGTRNWVPNHQILRDSMKMLAKLYPLCFWCCKRLRIKFHLGLREWTERYQKGLEKQTHQVLRWFCQKLMGRLWGLALQGVRTRLQMHWGNINLKHKNINISLKYLIYLITTAPKNVLWEKFQGEKHSFWFLSLLSIQLDPPLESHVQDSHGRKTDWKAKKSIHPEEVTYNF